MQKASLMMCRGLLWVDHYIVYYGLTIGLFVKSWPLNCLWRVDHWIELAVWVLTLEGSALSCLSHLPQAFSLTTMCLVLLSVCAAVPLNTNLPSRQMSRKCCKISMACLLSHSLLRGTVGELLRFTRSLWRDLVMSLWRDWIMLILWDWMISLQNRVFTCPIYTQSGIPLQKDPSHSLCNFPHHVSVDWRFDQKISPLRPLVDFYSGLERLYLAKLLS